MRCWSPSRRDLRWPSLTTERGHLPSSVGGRSGRKFLSEIVLTLPGFGVNESGAEFGENNLPGVYVCPKPRRRLYDTNPRFCSKGTDYIWPEPSAISTLAKAGMNIFRVQFKMERLTPDGMTGAYNEDYLANLTAVSLKRPSRIKCWCLTDCRPWMP